MNCATFIMPQSDVSNNHSIIHRRNHPGEHREATPKKKEESIETTTILIAPIRIHHSHHRLLFACYHAPTPSMAKILLLPSHTPLYQSVSSQAHNRVVLGVSIHHQRKAVAPFLPCQLIMPTCRADKSKKSSKCLSVTR